jgi:hypothetical protein
MTRCLFPLLAAALLAQRPWQQIAVPSVGDAAANFKTPPREYWAIHWAIWGGELTKERIVSEFDSLVANGVYIVNFGPSQHMSPKYFSPEHLALTKFAVDEAVKRGMRVWINRLPVRPRIASSSRFPRCRWVTECSWKSPMSTITRV